MQAQLRKVGIEVVPLRAGRAVLARRTASWCKATSTSASSRGSDVDGTPRRTSTGAEPRNYTGYCQRLVTRDLDQRCEILDLSRRVVLNRVDRKAGEGRARYPAAQNPLVFAAGRRSGTSSLGAPTTSSGTWRTGGSRTRASRGARRLAPRRLGSGRRRRAGASRRRSRSLRSARRAAVPQPTARACIGRSGCHAAVHRREGPRARVRRQP